MPGYLGIFYTIPAWFFSMIYFRAETVGNAHHILKTIWNLNPDHFMAFLRLFTNWNLTLLIGLSISGHLLQIFPIIPKFYRVLPLWFKTLLFSTLFFWLLHYYPIEKTPPFIYFQF